MIGMVKWFNNKTGFGFIQCKDEDIFVHYKQLVCGDNQYKYLVQGEYVQFDQTALTDGPHKTMATNVTGIEGGPLMCVTRQKMKESARE